MVGNWKMKKYILVFALLGFFATQPAAALVAGPARVIGTLKSFDTKKVVIESEEYRYEVPAEFVDTKNLKSGSKVEILLSLEQSDKVKAEKKKK
jgi:hypothetical protein